MSNICIVTDSSAQFTNSRFLGKNIVRILHLNAVSDRDQSNGEPLEVKHLPQSIASNSTLKLQIPQPDEISQLLANLLQTNDEIYCIFQSSSLSPLYANAQKATSAMMDKNRIHLINSESTSTGLGYIIEKVAASIAEGASTQEIERVIYHYIPHVFIVLCIPGLSYLHINGYLDHSQAMIGEMLKILPTFAIEEGVLTPYEKMRNYRHTLDFFQEFLSEFDNLEHISLIQSVPPRHNLTRLLREHMRSEYPAITYSETRLNIPLAVMFGPATTGIVAIESSSKKRNAV